MDSGVRQNGATATRYSQRRLERAIDHVNKLWFPVNPEMVEKINAGIHEGVYDLDIDFLFLEVKNDYALYMHCLRKLSAMLTEESGEPNQNIAPVEIFRRAGLTRIREVLEDSALVSGAHTLGELSGEQMSRLKEAVVSASVAETVAERNDIEPGMSYTVALMRQLGLTLIAWNYPRVYHRTISQLETGKSLDDALNEALGFSPSLLASSLVSQWGFSSDVVDAVGDSTHSDGKDISSISKTLRNICEAGEALARANDPDRYPTAEHDWHVAKETLESYLGSDAIKLIQTKLVENCAGYLEQYPDLFRDMKELDPETKLTKQKSSIRSQNNPYIKQCRPHLRKKLNDLYDRLDGSVSRENINTLIKDIIPFAGYTGGCIFILDPTSHQLVPRVTIDSVSLIDVEAISLDPGKGESSSPIVTAFSCTSPIMENVLSMDSGLVSYVAGVIGKSKKAGVLYLEMTEVALRNTDVNRLLRFKAVRQTLNDCLNLQ